MDQKSFIVQLHELQRNESLSLKDRLEREVEMLRNRANLIDEVLQRSDLLDTLDLLSKLT